MNRVLVSRIRAALWLACGAVWMTVASGPLRGDEDLTALEEQAVRAAVERVGPSVVRIETLGGLEQLDAQPLGTGPTTGLIVSEDGYIVSSSLGFAGQPTSILVTLPAGDRVPATIVARDRSRMLVLLKVSAPEPLAVPEPAPREQWAVGQWTIAAGRTYPGPLPNVSVGVLSATNRIWGKAVQTDAKISPSNYGGPLIDIRGRVIGILVPLSPQRQGDLAGAEWYDSGIGFAVPLVDLVPHLPAMKRGQDLFPGLLGITLVGTDIYALPATIATCPAKSPARLAGLRAGDTIVEIDAVEITRQAQLRHALGPRVAGDTVRIVALRGPESTRIETTIELAAHIEPYVRPDLGLLPLRPGGAPEADADAPAPAGVIIRHVFPDGAAAQAGLRAGDRLVGINDWEIDTAETLREVIIGFDPEEAVSAHIVRDGQAQTYPITLGRSTATIPDSPLPAPHGPLPPVPADRPPVGVIQIRIPESANACVAYVPENYHPHTTYGLLVWLHPPGNFEQDELIRRWKTLCEEHALILLAPQAADPRRWMSTEIEFVRRTIDELIARYRVDMTRLVLHGYQAGGAMAYHVALDHREIARAVARSRRRSPAGLAISSRTPFNHWPFIVYPRNSRLWPRGSRRANSGCTSWRSPYWPRRWREPSGI